LIQQELVVKMVPSDRGQLDPAVIFGFQAVVEEDLAARPAITTPKTTSTTKSAQPVILNRL